MIPYILIKETSWENSWWMTGAWEPIRMVRSKPTCNYD